MKDLMEMSYEISKKTVGVLMQQQVFTKELLQEIAKEEIAEIAPYLTCVFDVIKHEYIITLKIPMTSHILHSDGNDGSQKEKEKNTMGQSEDPKKKHILTDNERVECTVKWLNALYKAWIKEEEAKIPCAECRYSEKECSRNNPPQANFKVLEQFTGEGSVISPLID